jgi:hypothetical protein
MRCCQRSPDLAILLSSHDIPVPTLWEGWGLVKNRFGEGGEEFRSPGCSIARSLYKLGTF